MCDLLHSHFFTSISNDSRDQIAYNDCLKPISPYGISVNLLSQETDCDSSGCWTVYLAYASYTVFVKVRTYTISKEIDLGLIPVFSYCHIQCSLTWKPKVDFSKLFVCVHLGRHRVWRLRCYEKLYRDIKNQDTL